MLIGADTDNLVLYKKFPRRLEFIGIDTNFRQTPQVLPRA